SGTALAYSTYLGGSYFDIGYAIAVDGQGNACVTGNTNSTNFPLQNPFQSSLSPEVFDDGDAFVAKLSASGSSLVFSTYLGGPGLLGPFGGDWGLGIAEDGGNVYVAGLTESQSFPTLNAFQGQHPGGQDSWGDGFVTKFNATGTLVYSTYL